MAIDPGKVLKEEASGKLFVVTDGTAIIEVWQQIVADDGERLRVRRTLTSEGDRYLSDDGRVFYIVPDTKTDAEEA